MLRAVVSANGGPGVFLSHAAVDKPFTVQIRRALEDLGVVVWMGSRELAAGDPLRADIRKAIEITHRFVMVIGLQTMDSEWVQ